MSWRVIVITGVAKLDLKMGFLVVRKEATTKIQLSEIHTVIISSTAVSLTTALLNEMIRQKIKVIFCDETHNPSGELIACHGSHDSSMKIRMQMDWPQPVKEAVWTEIVGEKIRKQKELLAKLCFEKQADLLESYVRQMTMGDPTNREGHAAKVYFDALFGLQFTRSADCAVNSALNYGYSIILSAFNREITANGYLTQLGLWHDNRFNPFNFACDLMEPFRPLVDRTVISMSPEEFGKEEKTELISLLNSQVKIDNSIQRLSNAIRIYCSSIFKALNEQDISLIRFYSYEL